MKLISLFSQKTCEYDSDEDGFEGLGGDSGWGGTESKAGAGWVIILSPESSSGVSWKVLIVAAILFVYVGQTL